MPPMPPISGAPPAGLSSFFSANTQSVVKSIAATDAAFSKAIRVTFLGSIIPASLKSIVELPEYAKNIGFNWSINVQCNDICNPLGVSYKLAKEGKFIVTSPNTCTFSWSIYGQRLNFDVEPLKETVNIKGDGPYKWVEKIV